MKAEEIAAGLTTTQKRAVLTVSAREWPVKTQAHWSLAYMRLSKVTGVARINGTYRHAMMLTELGLAVRAAIMKGEQHD